MISRLPTLDLAYYPKEKGPYNNAELSQFLLDPKKLGWYYSYTKCNKF